jgi:hypothetical protein
MHDTANHPPFQSLSDRGNPMKVGKGDQVVVDHGIDAILYTIESLYDKRYSIAKSVWKIVPVAELAYQSRGISVGIVIPVSRLLKPTKVQLAAQG